MSERLALRRHLYDQLADVGRVSRGRGALRRQIALLAAPAGGPDDGRAGVREPRRPSPTTDPARG